MLSVPLLLTVLLAQVPSVPRPGALACQDLQRIEVSPMNQALSEICVSPRFVTGFRFDAPVSVDLQDETRFEDVARNRTRVQLRPPKDMRPGERLRLSAKYLDGTPKDEVVFMLVAVEDEATRQVEVFRDQRSREALDLELKRERANNQRLKDELTQLRQSLRALREQNEDPPHLVGLILGLREDDAGYRIEKVDFSLMDLAEGSPLVVQVRVFRTASRVAFDLRLEGGNTETQRTLGASVWDARGEHARVVHVRRDDMTSQDGHQLMIVEVVTSSGWPHGQVSLRLQDEAEQGVTATGMQLR
jgi:uncharacterized protein (TIGR02268 family)